MSGAGVPTPEKGSLESVGEGRHEVAAGEGMSSIAAKYGHFWETLWNGPANAELRKARTDPEVLLPGDRVTVPPLRTKSIAIRTGAVHTFRRRGVPAQIGFRLRASDGTIFPGKRYQLTVGAKTYSGHTDEQGRLRAWVAPEAVEARLKIWPDEPYLPETLEWSIRIGHLNPIGSISGVQARLNNLGFACPEDDVLGPETRAALSAFQRRQGLPETGEPDGLTTRTLLDEHGS